MKLLHNFTVPLLVILPTIVGVKYIFNQETSPVCKTKPFVEEKNQSEPVYKIDNLVEALIQVESRGKEDAIGDKHLGEPSVGVLQIRPVMIEEVNRILEKKNKKLRFNLRDRFSRLKSIQIFNIWKNYYHSNSTIEKIARCWNGGPRGWKNKSTLRYWKKVENELYGESI